MPLAFPRRVPEPSHVRIIHPESARSLPRSRARGVADADVSSRRASRIRRAARTKITSHFAAGPLSMRYDPSVALVEIASTGTTPHKRRTLFHAHAREESHSH